MTPQQAIEALHALPGGGKPTLDRMRALMEALGNPERSLKCIQIAGTNGKGTLAVMTACILTRAGYKTGLTISPYVTDFRERFQIDGRMIPPETLADLTERVLDAADAVQAAGGPAPVQFEVVTAVAFLWFAQEKCDLVVLETGLGGRYDATNVVPNTLVSAITRIGMDHMALLGNTIAEIANEKAGIIKEGCTVVCYPDQPPEAMGPILSAAAEKHVTIVTPEPEDLVRRKGRPLENRIDYGGYEVALNFPGRHQGNHAAMAVEIALTLWREYGYDISDEAILEGLRVASLPARIEVLRRHPLLLLDGCHNPDGASGLAQTLADAGYADNLVAVIGMVADKDCDGFLEKLEPCFAKVFTTAPATPRALSAEDMYQKARFHFDAEVGGTVAEAIRKAVDYADDNTLAGVVVCGSLYLAAEARPLLLEEAKN
ncbi:bifunctional folylpolyglutamate synthase/dihydrofolate synthase [Subdoligranulum sp. DSM 109015]|uniref:tetrahydrofolate synthase n=1 Tax=Gemmiger gallinarum TaxID=2779354 RepID=A0ABR9R4Y5_9FIRM|nr:folylpolyglutamate synthase/dihydrofolate synthase family protein [Gemmiger gallinarum]MBE5037977.1 bifunctional folylpolyglutamate synthase/dihydrofolate synthase [Gemmiger gallinarum]